MGARRGHRRCRHCAIPRWLAAGASRYAGDAPEIRWRCAGDARAIGRGRGSNDRPRRACRRGCLRGLYPRSSRSSATRSRLPPVRPTIESSIRPQIHQAQHDRNGSPNTGSAFGTMAILFPLVGPLAASVSAGSIPFMQKCAEINRRDRDLSTTPRRHTCPLAAARCLGATLGGSIFGNICSPIADTTILTALSTRGAPLPAISRHLPPSPAISRHLLPTCTPRHSATWQSTSPSTCAPLCRTHCSSALSPSSAATSRAD